MSDITVFSVLNGLIFSPLLFYLFSVVLIACYTLYLFNRNLNHVSLVYMFSLRFSESKFLKNLLWQFCVRTFFSCTQSFSFTSFCWFCSLFILRLKLLFSKCINYVLGLFMFSFIKTCSLTGC